MILISQTYELYLPRDPEDDCCEPDETGYELEDEPVEFRELVETLRGGEGSDSRLQPAPVRPAWVTHYGEMNYRTGEVRNISVHFSPRNPERKRKYWDLALRAAGCVR